MTTALIRPISIQKKTCIGIVHIVDEWSATSKRMVISLDEANLTWGPKGVTTNAINVDDGMANMTTIKAIPGWENDYPAFKWCDDKAKASGKNWFLASDNELSSIDNTKINKAIAKLKPSAPLMEKSFYWSSTEYTLKLASVYNPFDSQWPEYKNDENGYVRACLVF